MPGALRLPAQARTQLPSGDCDALLGNIVTLDGSAPQNITIYGAVDYVSIAPEGGEVYYAINGVLATALSPGYVPEDGRQVVGPIANFSTLSIYSNTADTAVHLQFCRQPGQQGHVRWPTNWWNPNSEALCIWAAYRPKEAASFAESLVDLSGNGHDAGDPGGANTPSWSTANGWEFTAGNSEYLTTTFVAANDQSQSILAQFSNNPDGGNGLLFGSQDTSSTRRFAIQPDSGGADNLNFYNGDRQSALFVAHDGNVAIAGDMGYYDGVAIAGVPATIPAWGGANAMATYIGCWNNTGVPALFITANIQALAIYDCVLTAPQILAIATAMAAL